MAVARAIGVALAALMLAGCQNMVASSGVYYNDGLAEASNSLLLANVIRSAKGHPNYYSAIGDYSGSTSVGSGPTLSANIPTLNTLDETSFDFGLAPTASRDRNANVSSLETTNFTRAMHTQVTPQLLTFLTESRDSAHIHLLLALLVKTTRVKLSDYDEIVFSARDECGQRFQTLSIAQKGICRNFEALLADPTCDFALEAPPSGNALITLINDPTNRCAFNQFRIWVESLMLKGERVEIDEDGELDLILAPTGSAPRDLFEAEGTGIALRTPNGIVNYLGEIVRAQFSREDGWTPALTTRDGQTVPIFKVESGPPKKRATVSAKVDGEHYWIRRQDLGAKETDFSYPALTIVKDLQALNTAEDQLPNSPAIILGPGSSVSR